MTFLQSPVSAGNYDAYPVPSYNILNVQDSSFESAGLGSWGPYTNSSIVNSTAQAAVGTHSLAMTATAIGDASAAGTQYIIFPRKACRVRGQFRAATTSRVNYIQIWPFDASSTFLGAINSSGITDSSSTWTQLSAGIILPPTTAFVQPLWIVSAAAAGEVHYLDDVWLTI